MNSLKIPDFLIFSTISSVFHSKENLMNTTAKFHLTAAAFGVLIASSVYAETNQVYSNTVQAHNAPMTVDVIMKDGKTCQYSHRQQREPRGRQTGYC